MSVEKEALTPPSRGVRPLYVFFNGDIVLEEEALVSVRDRGFLYGDGLFETLRSYNGRPFLLEDHLERLASSAKALDIPLNRSPEELRQAVEDLLKRNKLKEAYIRITLSRGESWHYGLEPHEPLQPTLVIETRPFKPHPEESYKQGMSLIVSDYRRSTTCPLGRHKTSNFLLGILAKQEAKRKGAQDALLLNTDGDVCEATVSNIFMVEGGKVVTPSLKANILLGITRKTVLALCKQEKIPISSELFKTERLLKADEAFLTNSLVEIMPVATIENSAIGKSVPGKTTKRIMEAYKRLTQMRPGEEEK
jgi:branched-chain amino acid aminotransferase